MILIAGLLSSWTTVGVEGGNPNSTKNWRDHIIGFEAINGAKYSASVEERVNNFAFFEIVMHDDR